MALALTAGCIGMIASSAAFNISNTLGDDMVLQRAPQQAMVLASNQFSFAFFCPH
jgi:hypothetical protein